jgi:hypothetical protein
MNAQEANVVQTEVASFAVQIFLFRPIAQESKLYRGVALLVEQGSGIYDCVHLLSHSQGSSVHHQEVSVFRSHLTPHFRLRRQGLKEFRVYRIAEKNHLLLGDASIDDVSTHSRRDRKHSGGAAIKVGFHLPGQAYQPGIPEHTHLHGSVQPKISDVQDVRRSFEGGEKPTGETVKQRRRLNYDGIHARKEKTSEASGNHEGDLAQDSFIKTLIRGGIRPSPVNLDAVVFPLPEKPPTPFFRYHTRRIIRKGGEHRNLVTFLLQTQGQLVDPRLRGSDLRWIIRGKKKN